MSMSLRVQAIRWEARRILSYELRLPEGGELPDFTAGAHIDLSLPNGMVRSYSLLNSQLDRHRYIIAVQNDRASRGGSKWIHENLRVGHVMQVSEPRNNFRLSEDADASVFIAGGIGITPILSMIERLNAIGKQWQLIYCTRKRTDTAFLEYLHQMPQVHFNFDEEPGGAILDIVSVVKSLHPDAHIYCCGPSPMLTVFETATSDLGHDRVHIEYFTAQAAPVTQGGFKVVLAKSGREFVIPQGKTILETLLE
ncbi:MAG: ferredoxin reductase, partial [Ktedonobacteraceae bacterium]